MSKNRRKGQPATLCSFSFVLTISSGMNKLFTSVFCAILLAGHCVGAPAASALPISNSTSATPTVHESVSIEATSTTSTAASPTFTVPLASDDPNFIEWNVTTTEDVQPIRGSLGATILGPENIPIDQQNPDILAPPTTDAGSM